MKKTICPSADVKKNGRLFREAIEFPASPYRISSRHPTYPFPSDKHSVYRELVPEQSEDRLCLPDTT